MYNMLRVVRIGVTYPLLKVLIDPISSLDTPLVSSLIIVTSRLHPVLLYMPFALPLPYLMPVLIVTFIFVLYILD